MIMLYYHLELKTWCFMSYDISDVITYTLPPENKFFTTVSDSEFDCSPSRLKCITKRVIGK
ncbi:hypothetical protein GGP41_000292 [Bipolaris sorokiniana]|uniref:Uncharacterized protein n=1 Tax=Cochliobolus sativus TaxID=45130 RepID=A0A8H5ZF38_COCSA|nr:hypothetical protein GGP41_000292 [Bipolaris sorokiniana]